MPEENATTEIDATLSRYNEAVAPIMEQQSALAEQHKAVLKDFLAEGKELRYKYLIAVDRELQEAKDKVKQLRDYEAKLRERLRFLKQFPAI